VAQAQHVLRMLALRVDAHAGLANHEGLNPSVRSFVTISMVGM
jgi:hypothetical protein